MHQIESVRRFFARFILSVIVAISTICGVSQFSQNTHGQQPSEEQQPASAEGKSTKRMSLREGTRIDSSLGWFQITGEGADFISGDKKLKLGALENLVLERILRTIRENPDQREWSISGQITEYEGTNYILIDHALLKTKKSDKISSSPDSVKGEAE